MEKAYVINGIKQSSIRNMGDSEEERGREIFKRNNSCKPGKTWTFKFMKLIEHPIISIQNNLLQETL